MNKCNNLELTNESAPLMLMPSSRQGGQPKSATRITITQSSPRHARERSLLLIEAEPRIDHKKSLSGPIAATSYSCKRQCSRKEATVSFASLPNQTHVPRQGEQPKPPTGITITITQSSPCHARKSSLLLIEAEPRPRIDRKKSSSKPITTTSSHSLSRKA